MELSFSAVGHHAEHMFLLARTEFVLNDVIVSVSSTLLSKNKDKKGDLYNV